MNTNVNRLGNAPQFVLLPEVTSCIAGTTTIDVEMLKGVYIDYVEALVTVGFPASSSIKAGSTEDDDLFLASTTTNTAGIKTSSGTIANRLKQTAADNIVRLTITGGSAATTPRMFVKIYYIFAPNSELALDPDHINTSSAEKKIVQPNYLLL